MGAATAEFTPEEPSAQHLAQGRPLMAPRESNAISIFWGKNQFSGILFSFFFLSFL